MRHGGEIQGEQRKNMYVAAYMFFCVLGEGFGCLDLQRGKENVGAGKESRGVERNEVAGGDGFGAGENARGGGEHAYEGLARAVFFAQDGQTPGAVALG